MCSKGPVADDEDVDFCRSFHPSVGRSSLCGSRSTHTSTLHPHRIAITSQGVYKFPGDFNQSMNLYSTEAQCF